MSGGVINGEELPYSGDHHHHHHKYRHVKAEIATHPFYEQLLAAHVSCLRVATPIDHLPLIDAQLSQSYNLLHSYAASRSLSPRERQDLDNFLVLIFDSEFALCQQ